MKYKIYTCETDVGPDWGYEFESDGDIEEAAVEFANDYHNNHDGWEDNWPVTFIVGDSDGKVLGKVKVEREYDPIFYGSLLK